MKHSGLLLVLSVLLAAPQVQAALYRWVDANGQVQYSDKPPVNGAPQGVTVLDQQGMVRQTPAPTVSPEEKARQQAVQTQLQGQQRHDRALLQSFSNTSEIDILRDRQIDAVQAGLQTNSLRRQAAQAKLARLNTQIGTLQKRGKAPPADWQRDIAATQKEMAQIDADSQTRQARITQIRHQAEADKQRLLALQGGNTP